MTTEPETTAPLWPDPPELAHMSGQFKLGYRQAQTEAAAEIERLRWLPARASDDHDPWDGGWNRCLEYILDRRSGIEPGTGEHS